MSSLLESNILALSKNKDPDIYDHSLNQGDSICEDPVLYDYSLNEGDSNCVSDKTHLTHHHPFLGQCSARAKESSRETSCYTLQAWYLVE